MGHGTLACTRGKGRKVSWRSSHGEDGSTKSPHAKSLSRSRVIIAGAAATGTFSLCSVLLVTSVPLTPAFRIYCQGFGCHHSNHYLVSHSDGTCPKRMNAHRLPHPRNPLLRPKARPLQFAKIPLFVAYLMDPRLARLKPQAPHGLGTLSRCGGLCFGKHCQVKESRAAQRWNFPIRHANALSGGLCAAAGPARGGRCGGESRRRLSPRRTISAAFKPVVPALANSKA